MARAAGSGASGTVILNHRLTGHWYLRRKPLPSATSEILKDTSFDHQIFLVASKTVLVESWYVGMNHDPGGIRFDKPGKQ